MLYSIFKPLIQLTIRFFFRNYQVNGLENIPKNGPFIFASNHPATFMDGIILAATLKQKVYFVAKSTVFKSRFAKWFLPKLNMIPVNRKQDGVDPNVKNNDMFETCFNHLAKNGSILIFPEGVSVAERKIKEVKSGAARIALGAEEKNNFSLGVKIVCIGINYSDKGTFQSNVLINISKPIDISEYKTKYASDSIGTAREITARIKENLETLTVSLQELENDELVKRVEEVYKIHVLEEVGASKKNKVNDFNVTKAICEHLEYYKKNEPDKLNAIKQKVDTYYAELTALGMSDVDLRRVTSGKNIVNLTFWSMVYFTLAFPLFLAGFITNYIPYFLTIQLTRKISPHIEYRVAISMIGGMFLFILNLVGLTLLANALLDSFWINCAVVVLVPLAGLYAFKYNQFYIRVLKRWKAFSLFYKNSVVVAKMIQMRNDIIAEFERLRMQYETSVVTS